MKSKFYVIIVVLLSSFVVNDASTFTGMGGTGSVSIDDIDGDRHEDVTVVDEQSENVAILLGNGDGTFQAASFYGAGKSPCSVAIADFDGDGKRDLAVTNHDGDDVTILLNAVQ